MSEERGITERDIAATIVACVLHYQAAHPVVPEEPLAYRQYLAALVDLVEQCLTNAY